MTKRKIFAYILKNSSSSVLQGHPTHVVLCSKTHVHTRKVVLCDGFLLSTVKKD